MKAPLVKENQAKIIYTIVFIERWKCKVGLVVSVAMCKMKLNASLQGFLEH